MDQLLEDVFAMAWSRIQMRGMVREMVEDLSELALMKAEMFGMREMVVEVDKVNDDLGKSSRLMVDQVLREIRIQEAVRRQEVWRSMIDVLKC